MGCRDKWSRRKRNDKWQVKRNGATSERRWKVLRTCKRKIKNETNQIRGSREKWQEERLCYVSEKPCTKMPAHTKEQVFGGLRFQAERTDGITEMLTFMHNKGGLVHGRYVVLRENMHKRLRHYEPCNDDSYEMLLTGYLGLDLYYTLTIPDI